MCSSAASALTRSGAVVGGLVPVSPLIDPRFDGGDLLRGERALHRHRGLLESGDSTIQPALLRAAGDDGRALVAALERAFARAQVETRRLEIAVTALARGVQDGPDVSRKRNRFLRSRDRRNRTGKGEAPYGNR
jgi:hypothetical protein